MERTLEAAEECFQIDGAVAPVIGMGRARVRRLRRDVVIDFRESIREIAPLYEELRRENALARGASHALEFIAKQGLSSITLPERLCVCNWQQQGLFSDAALESYFVTLSGYIPTRPQALCEGTVGTARDHIRLEEFDALVIAALPIADAIALYAAGRLSDLALTWLRSPEMSQCRFIHCGDYDPVGLDEFLRLKTAVGELASLYLPANLKDLIAKYGHRKLLRDSEAVLKRLRRTSDPAVRQVLNILDETGCGLEQEVLLIDRGIMQI